MKPYYDEGGITIYHGDCREVLPTLDGKTIQEFPLKHIRKLTDPSKTKEKGQMELDLQ